ncbi:glycosyltransferase [Mycobacterium sp. 050134]|uniref:glycosyltransferase n=1 Tax=Mycobacterium sp. 050134 TaxID=3096111 RepID=UPI002EDAD9BE
MKELDRAYLKRPVAGAAALPSVRPLAVLIVNDADHAQLGVCLGRLAAHLPELPVHVYDNVDDRGGRAELADRYPGVHWVAGTAKVGLAEAFNALAERVASDADLLLVDAGTSVLGPLARTRDLLRRPGVAAVSPLVRDATAAGRTPWDVASRRRTVARGLTAAAGASESLRRTSLSPLYARQPAEIHCITGDLSPNCLAISRAAWNTLGGFDEEFFGDGEAADWQERARAAGWRILLADELGAERARPVRRADVERRRAQDLARANAALLLEHQDGVHHADVYLAGTTLLERIQRKLPRAGRRGDLPAIVITTNRLIYGGAERQKVLLATELDRRGYPVTVACVQRFGPLVREIPPTVRVVRQPWWAPHVDLPDGPAVIISGDSNTETGFATVWRAAGAGRGWLVAPHTHPDMPIYSRPLVAAMNRSDGFIMLAQRHWEMLAEQHRLTRRHFVAPNGVVIPGPPHPRVRPAGDRIRLVMLSRIVEFKNPHLLVDALSGLTELPWELSIFGDGPDREMLEARTPAALRDRVHWRGWADGPEPALADADLLCMPSRCETFPLVILEAMARGIPVVSSAVCAVPEMLDFGRAGFLVEDVSVRGWRESLAAILADPAALPSVGQRGFERMSKHYTIEAMADAYVDAINEVL